MQTTLTLIRGLPGSGKSTLAELLSYQDNHIHYETDMYFIKDGVYQYDASKIKDAHMACQRHVRSALANAWNVIVSNTFTQMWEMRPYLEMPYTNLKVIECHGKFQNIHNVPNEVIEKMRARWEPYQP